MEQEVLAKKLLGCSILAIREGVITKYFVLSMTTHLCMAKY